MSRWQRRAGCLLAVVLVAAAVGACGKRGSLRPPEGEAANYTYPRVYPPAAEEEQPEAEPPPLPSGSSAPEKLSPFPLPFERETPTTTYGTE